MEAIRVLVVDDQGLLRDGIRTVLELEGGFTIVGAAGDGEEAITLYRTEHPDVVLMDIRMPRLDGIEATKRIVEENPAARVLMLTTFSDDDLLFDALRAGARGYLLKDASGAELASAIRQVFAGNAALEPGMAMKLVESMRSGPGAQGDAEASGSGRPEGEVSLKDAGGPDRPGPGEAASPGRGRSGRPPASGAAFSRRETEVLRLLAEGFSNKEIAERLFLAEGTVKNRVSDILLKIDARDRTQAALRARELGLL